MAVTSIAKEKTKKEPVRLSREFLSPFFTEENNTQFSRNDALMTISMIARGCENRISLTDEARHFLVKQGIIDVNEWIQCQIAHAMRLNIF